MNESHSDLRRTIRVVSGRGTYDVRVGVGLLHRLGPMVRDAASTESVCLVFDERIEQFGYPGEAARSLAGAGFRVATRGVPSGEPTKSLDLVRQLYAWFASERVERATPVVVLGGGVTGDCVGFAAATYLRGCPLVHCPTTLVAMADSSIGGKVAVNLPEGKNLVGAFHAPLLVLADTRALRSLPRRALRAGLAECINHGLGLDAALFEWTELNLERIEARDDDATLVEFVARNVAVKGGVVAEDEREQGRRALLNLGHTFGHAIELCAGYGELLHGEAVALGTVAACNLAVALGILDERVAGRYRALLHRAGLRTRAPLPAIEALIAAMQSDKKRRNGALRLVLPTALGASTLVPCPDERLLIDAWRTIGAA